MSENPFAPRGVARDDVLSALLATIRLAGSLQFCFMPAGAWQTDATPSLTALAGRAGGTMPFHVVAEGRCWMRLEDREAILEAGDVVIFPFGTGHQLGSGENGILVHPTEDLPPKPWREIPVLRYGDGPCGLRLLCGYLQCNAVSFAPLRQALPTLIHVTTRGSETAWLRAAIAQMVNEVDNPRPGGVAMLPRLTEIVFIEILRHQIETARPGSGGWLAALADKPLSRCLSLIHDAPRKAWRLDELAASSGLSRSALAQRFQTILGTSPIRYIREWRLYLASVALSTTPDSIADVAHEAGYATEAAFNRAFTRALGMPPAAWRRETTSHA